MAKKPADKATTTVTRIKANDEPAPAKKAPAAPVKKAKTAVPTTTKTKKRTANPFRAIIGYFVGAWTELRQVRWPTRGATWSLTAAVAAFTAFFAVLILLLDALFKYVFQLILG